jgi:hypothetical protein
MVRGSGEPAPGGYLAFAESIFWGMTAGSLGASMGPCQLSPAGS